MELISKKLSYVELILICLSFICMTFASIIFIPLCAFFGLISFVNYALIKLRYGNGFSCATGMDIMHSIEKSNSTPCVSILFRHDGNISFEKFREHIWDRYQMKDYPISSRRLRRYQQRFVRIAGYSYFIDDPNPDMDYHLVEITKEDLYNDHKLWSDQKAADSFIDDEEAKDEFHLMADHIMKKYDHHKMDTNKAQWRIFFYKQEHSFLYMFQFNHLITDGVHFVRFLLSEFGDESVMQELPFNYKQPGRIQKAMTFLWAYFMLPWGIAAGYRDTQSSPLKGPKLSGKKIRICSEIIPLKHFKEIRNACKTSFNSILFSCTAYALRCHYRAKGKSIPDTYMMSPVSLQDIRKEIKTKNSHGMMTVMLHTEAKDAETDCAIERLKITQKDVTAAENDLSFHPSQLVLRMLCPLLPNWINNILLDVKGFTMALSNMPIPSNGSIRIGGTCCKDIVGWLTDRDPMGLGVAFIGYLDNMRIGLHADMALMKTNKEAYDFLDNIHKEFSNLRRELGLEPTTETAEVYHSK